MGVRSGRRGVADTIRDLMAVTYCIWALLVFLAAPAAAQQAPAASSSHSFTVFLRGSPVGREEVAVRTDASGTTITGESRLAPPLGVVTRKAELKYRPDWTPESFVLDTSVGTAALTLNTTFANGVATSTGSDSGRAIASTTPVQPRTLIVPSVFFGAYEALGRRFAGGDTAGEFHAFSGPDVNVVFRVRSTATERMQTGTSTFNVRRYELVFAIPTGDIVINLSTDEAGGLIRVSIPVQGIDVVREDVASATARTQIFSAPGDEAVMIPGTGFSLGATITRPASLRGGGAGQPAAASAARFPAVVLLSGSDANDRDGYMAGVPIIGQLAGALADAGYLAVRYDKRGYGQSGGRAESTTLTDLADDASGVVRWLQKRKDVDARRVAVVGHSEGAWVALLAASRDKRIAAVVSIAAPASTGDALVLEQQLLGLNRLSISAADREAKIALQKRIHAAVLTGGGWEGVPREMRRQADTPWFQSLLAYDPAKVLKGVRQPLLFVHGQLDRQVPLDHLERIAGLARKASKSKAVEVVTVRGVNHLLIPATTGEVGEYSALQERTVSGDVTAAIANWLARALGAAR